MTTPVHCFVFNVIPTAEYDYYDTSVQVNHPVPGMYHVNSLAKGSSPMFIKKAGPLVAGAAIAIATVTAVAPTAGAAERVSAERQVTFTCLGTGSELSTVSPNTFEVTYPEEVAPGEIFTVSVQPGAMRNNARAVNRMTFDYALPTNATILGLNLAGNATGLSGVAPSVVRVNQQAKTTNATGTVARIWGGVSARFGTSTSTTGTGGISVAANTDFRLPKLDVVLRAPAQVGAAVTIGLPGANEAHTGTTGTAASTDLQYLRASPSNPVQCSSGTEASALTTTTVGNLAPALLPSTTTLEGGQRTLGPNQPTQFTAKVTAEYGTAAVPQGKVVFRDVESNEILGSVNPGADGVAKLDHTFAPVASGQPDQTRQVVAQYAGVDGDIAASTSAPVTVTNTSAPTVFRELGFDVRAQLGVETAQDVPVTINATIVRPAGSVNPSQAMVQLYRGDTPVGAPVALPDGNQMTWTDTVIRQPRTTTQRYRVELVAPVVVDYVKWTSTAPQPVSVIVRGTDPSLDPPITGGGNGSLGNIFGS